MASLRRPCGNVPATLWSPSWRPVRASPQKDRLPAVRVTPLSKTSIPAKSCRFRTSAVFHPAENRAAPSAADPPDSASRTAAPPSTASATSAAQYTTPASADQLAPTSTTSTGAVAQPWRQPCTQQLVHQNSAMLRVILKLPHSSFRPSSASGCAWAPPAFAGSAPKP